MTTKRLAFVLVLACVFTVAFAGVALAAWNEGSDGYAANPGGTPHTGYATTTVKCAVCHAVHRATPAGQVLLRGTVSGACEFCHISNNVATAKVYGGDAANYNTDFTNNHYSAVGSRCVDCHTVHGASGISAVIGNINTKILKANIAAPQAVPNGSFTVGSNKEAVVSAFCTQCHAYYEGGYDDDATANDHIMGAAGNYGNTFASTPPQGTAVAYAPSTFCRSCHDAGATNNQGADPNGMNFPHYTKTAARFLLSGAYNGDLTATGAVDPSEDGACLKCHRADANTGVGKTY